MPFNKNFDEDLGKQIISVYREQTGCFHCRKPGPTHRCSKCQAVWYCNGDCQKADWKRSDGKTHHKDLCKIWCDNRAEEHGSPGPIPICMLSCGFIGESSMVRGMEVRTDLFLRELEQMMALDKTRPSMDLTASVIGMFGKIRLVVAANVIDDDESTRVRIGYVLVQEVEEGDPSSLHRLYQGSGTLSDTTKENVRKQLSEFAAKIKNHAGNISSVTFGRGLIFIKEDDGFQKSIEEAAGSSIAWMPDEG